MQTRSDYRPTSRNRYHNHSNFDDALMAVPTRPATSVNPPQHYDDVGAGATGCDRDASSSAAIPASQLRHCYEHIDGKINHQQEAVKLSRLINYARDPRLIPGTARLLKKILNGAAPRISRSSSRPDTPWPSTLKRPRCSTSIFHPPCSRARTR